MKDNVLEIKNKLITLMKNWNEVENYAILNTTNIIKKTRNPLIHLVMKVIRQDSAIHKKTQELIIKCLEQDNYCLESDENLEEIMNLLSIHNNFEKKTVELAIEFGQLFEMYHALNKENKEEDEEYNLISKKLEFVGFLLSYLLKDEKKHIELLDDLMKLDFKLNK